MNTSKAPHFLSLINVIRLKNGPLSALCGFQELSLQNDLQKRPFSGSMWQKIGVLHLSSQPPGTWGSIFFSQCLERLAQGDRDLSNKGDCHQVAITPRPHLKSSVLYPSLSLKLDPLPSLWSPGRQWEAWFLVQWHTFLI